MEQVQPSVVVAKMKANEGAVIGDGVRTGPERPPLSRVL